MHPVKIVFGETRTNQCTYTYTHVYRYKIYPAGCSEGFIFLLYVQRTVVA